MGIEPTWPAWKAGALPLSYTRRLEDGVGFEPTAPQSAGFQDRFHRPLGHPSGFWQGRQESNLRWRSQSPLPYRLATSLGAGNRDRTGTEVTLLGILSPLRLPIPPLRHMERDEWYRTTPDRQRLTGVLRRRCPHLRPRISYRKLSRDAANHPQIPMKYEV